MKLPTRLRGLFAILLLFGGASASRSPSPSSKSGVRGTFRNGGNATEVTVKGEHLGLMAKLASARNHRQPGTDFRDPCSAHAHASLSQMIFGPMDPGAAEPFGEEYTVQPKHMATGYFHIGCLKDAQTEQVRWYHDSVSSTERSPMVPVECFEFCRNVTGALYFGLTGGDKCYCTPFAIQGEDGGEMCDMPCSGDSSMICGGKVMSNMYAMHDCNNLPELKCTRPPPPAKNVEMFPSRYYRPKTYCANAATKAITDRDPLCEVHCLPGYYIYKNDLTCVEKGNRLSYSWADFEGSVACMPKLCGVPPEGVNSRRPPTVMFFPDTVQYVCAFGHSTEPDAPNASGPKNFTVGCQDTGLFTDVEECHRINCGVCPTHPHADFQQTGARVYEDICTYDCHKGYTTDQNAAGPKVWESKCHADGMFTSMHKCKPVKCPGQRQIPHAEIVYDDQGVHENIVFPMMLHYRCLEGYTLTGEVNTQNAFTRECQADGIMSLPERNCIRNGTVCAMCLPVACPAAPTVDHASYFPGARVYKEKLIYTCNYGYTLDGQADGPIVEVLTCTKDGSYDEPPPVCKPIECGAAPVHPNAQVTSTPPAMVTFASAPVEFKCNPGFSTDVGDNPYSVMKDMYSVSCLATGQYSPYTECVNMNNCLYNTCGNRALGTHGNCEDVASPSGTPLDDYECICHPGYEVTLHDMTPAIKEKICTNINDCPRPEPPEEQPCGGMTDAGVERGTCVDKVLGYMCECCTGYKLDNSTPANETCTPVVCGVVPELNFSSHDFGTEESHYDSPEWKYTCNEGYSLSGVYGGELTFPMFCNSAGQFEPLPPPCLPVTCGAAPVLGFATSYLQTMELVYNETAEYTCNEGYSLTAKYSTAAADISHEVECLFDGNYSIDGNRYPHELPTLCKPVECGTPTIIPNAHAGFDPADKMYVYPQTSLQLCDEGYSLDNSTFPAMQKLTLECLSDGTFSDPPAPECIRVACPVVEPNANMTCDMEAKVYEQEVECTADAGYSLDGTKTGETTFKVLCQANGTLTPVKQVLPINCGEPPNYLQAKFAAGPEASFVYPQQAWFTCLTGYSLDGDKAGSTLFSLGCQADGSFEEHAGCQPVSCGAWEAVPRAHQVEDTNGEKLAETVFGQHVALECDAGWSTDGVLNSILINGTIVCQADGHYSYPDICGANNNDCAAADNQCGPFGECTDHAEPTGVHFDDFHCDCFSGFAENDTGDKKTCYNIPDCPLQIVEPVQAEYVIVAGGGGGGSGGGGGGGVLQGSDLTIKAGDKLTVVVGAGGLGGSGGSGTWKEATKGGDSSVGSLVAIGGGKGAGGRSRTAGVGGSGGGGSYDRPGRSFGTGTTGQGNQGGSSNRPSYGAGGGGGGAGGPGLNAPAKHVGGDGGPGIELTIAGVSRWVGGGGGGGVNANCGGCTNWCGGTGGKGGGGEGSCVGGGHGNHFNGDGGAPNTGGGGGGTDPESNLAGNGGSGIVMIKYKSPMPMINGGEMKQDGDSWIHVFTQVGSTTMPVTGPSASPTAAPSSTDAASEHIACLPGTCTDLVNDYTCNCPTGYYEGADEMKGLKHSCLPVSCGKPRNVVKAEASTKEEQFFTSPPVEYTCKLGYTTDGDADGPTTFTSECLPNGTDETLGTQSWTPTCQPVKCHTAPTVVNGSILHRPADYEYTYDQGLTYECDKYHWKWNKWIHNPDFTYNNYCVSADGTNLQETLFGDLDTHKSECMDACRKNPDCSAIEWYASGSHKGGKCFHINTRKRAAKGKSGNRYKDATCTVLDVPTCSHDKFGIDFCGKWCNGAADGYWGCGEPTMLARDSRNTDREDYTCSCAGCNGCPIEPHQFRATCRETGNFEGVRTCTPMECKGTPEQANVNTNHTGHVLTYGQKLLKTCKPGYALNKDQHTHTTYHIECTAPGTNVELEWEPAGAACVPIDCGDFGYVPDAAVDGSTIFTGQMQVICNEGYSLDGSCCDFHKRAYNSTCMPNGTFSKTGGCEPVRCGVAPTVPFSDHDKGSAIQVFGDVPHYTVHAGYTLDSKGSYQDVKEFDVACTSGGVFAPTPNVYIIECGTAPTRDHAVNLAAHLSYSEEETYECITGFTMDGQPPSDTGSNWKFTLTCDETGHFAGHSGGCVPVDCGMVSAPQHSTLAHIQGSHYEHISPGCVNGNNIVLYSDKSVAECVALCDADAECLAFEYGVVHSGNGKYQARDCQLQSSANYHGCSGTGHDLDLYIKPTVMPPDHAKMNSLVYHEEAHFECNPGYSLDARLLGANVFHQKCMINGSMSYAAGCFNIDDCEANLCEPNGTCVDHASPTGVHSDDYHCECNDGFHEQIQKDTGKRFCGNVPDCPAGACEPGKCRDLVNDYKCICPPGYNEEPNPKEKLEKDCMPQTCGTCESRSPLTKAMCIGSSETFYDGDPVEFRCEHGYTLDGSPVESPPVITLACQADGNLEAHAGCEPVICGLPPLLNHSDKAVDQGRTQMTFGETIKYKCDTGYSLTGTADGDTEITSECTEKGTFSPSGFKCKPIKCPMEEEEWFLVFRQTMPYMFKDGELSKNPDDTSADNFAVLDELESYRTGTGFHFKISWPGEYDDQEWTQTSNPVTRTSGGVTGYKGINVPYTRGNWGGLEWTTGRRAGQSMMDGSIGNGRSYFIGTKYIRPDLPQKIPGPTIGGRAKQVNKVELYAKKSPSPFGAHASYPYSVLAKMVYSHSIDVTCNAGYSLDPLKHDETTYTAACEAKGELELPTKHSCKPIDCAPLPVVANGDIVGASTFGGKATVTAHEGWSLDGSGSPDTRSFDVTCAVTGQYVGVQAFTRVFCGPPPSALYGTEGLYFSETATYHLEECLTFSEEGAPGGERSDTIECKDDGEFTPGKPTYPITCGVPEDQDNSIMLFDGEVFCGGTVEYQCLPGHTLDGSASGGNSFTHSCGSNGNFTGPAGCMPVECGSPDVPKNAEGTTEKLTFSETITFHCSPGYSTDGMPSDSPKTSVVATCLATGKIEFSASCYNIDDCLTSANGVTKGTGECKDKPKPLGISFDDFHLECESGFREIEDTDPDGNKRKICENIDDCPDNACKPGSCNDLVNAYSCTCPCGYYAGPNPEAGLAEDCLLHTCPSIPQYDNAETANSSEVFAGESVSYTCDAGHYIDGQVGSDKFSISCQANPECNGPPEFSFGKTFNNYCVSENDVNLDDIGIGSRTTSLDDCKLLCKADPQCSGIEWYQRGRHGKSCFHIKDHRAKAAKGSPKGRYMDAVCMPKVVEPYKSLKGWGTIGYYSSANSQCGAADLEALVASLKPGEGYYYDPAFTICRSISAGNVGKVAEDFGTAAWTGHASGVTYLPKVQPVLYTKPPFPQPCKPVSCGAAPTVDNTVSLGVPLAEYKYDDVMSYKCEEGYSAVAGDFAFLSLFHAEVVSNAAGAEILKVGQYGSPPKWIDAVGQIVHAEYQSPLTGTPEVGPLEMPTDYPDFVELTMEACSTLKVTVSFREHETTSNEVTLGHFSVTILDLTTKGVGADGMPEIVEFVEVCDADEINTAVDSYIDEEDVDGCTRLYADEENEGGGTTNPLTLTDELKKRAVGLVYGHRSSVTITLGSTCSESQISKPEHEKITMKFAFESSVTSPAERPEFEALCADDGNWDGVLTCKPIKCGPLDPSLVKTVDEDNTTVATYDTFQAASLEYGKPLTVTCATNYVTSQEGGVLEREYQITCGADGKVDAPSKVCKRIDCGEAPHVAHSVIYAPESQEGVKIKYAAHAGFSLDGEPDSGKVTEATCTPNAEWTVPDVFVKVKCDAFPGVNNANLVPKGKVVEAHGCWSDNWQRALDYYQGSGHTFQSCKVACGGFPMFATQYYGQCFCGTEYNEKVYKKLKDSKCGNPCRGDNQDSCDGAPCRCGKAWTQYVYKFGESDKCKVIGHFEDGEMTFFDGSFDAGHLGGKIFSSIRVTGKCKAVVYSGGIFNGESSTFTRGTHDLVHGLGSIVVSDLKDVPEACHAGMYFEEHGVGNEYMEGNPRTDVATAQDCSGMCIMTENCTCFSYNGDQKFCSLLSACPSATQKSGGAVAGMAGCVVESAGKLLLQEPTRRKPGRRVVTDSRSPQAHAKGGNHTFTGRRLAQAMNGTALDKKQALPHSFWARMNSKRVSRHSLVKREEGYETLASGRAAAKAARIKMAAEKAAAGFEARGKIRQGRKARLVLGQENELPLSGDTQEYVCESGYRAIYLPDVTGDLGELTVAVSEPTFFTLECNGRGVIELEYKCLKVTCDIPSAADGEIEIPQSTGIVKLGDTVPFKCDFGYSLDGHPGGLKDFTEACGEDGTISADTECKAIDWCLTNQCGDYGKCENGKFSYTCKCDEGYKPENVGSGGHITCVEIDECETMGGHGNCAADKNYGICNDEHLGYSCNCTAGTQQETGQDGLPVCAAMACETVPVRSYMSSPMEGLKITYEQNTVYTCDPGYSLDAVPLGPSTHVVHCNLSDEETNNLVPAVEGVEAYGCWTDNINRALDYWKGAGHNYASCKASCGGFKLFALQYYGQCFCGNSYDANTYQEIDVSRCGAPCRGDSEDSCDGLPCHCGKGWTQFVYKFVEAPPVPRPHLRGYEVCLPVVCSALPTVEHANTSLETTLSYGDSATYACELGYSVDGFPDSPKDFSVSCTASGALTAPGKCELISCGQPPSVSFAAAPEVDLLYMETGTYKCDEGHTISGERPDSSPSEFEVQCQADGNFFGLTICQPVSCGVAPAINHSLNLPTAEVLYLEEFEVTCISGYTTDGSSSGPNHFIVGCDKEGDFVDVMECLPVTCGVPEETDTMISSDPEKYFGEVAHWTCKEGWSLSGLVAGARGAPPLTKLSKQCTATGDYGFATPGECQDIDYCSSNPCTHNGVCTDLGPGVHSPGYECDCMDGYEAATNADGGPTCTADDCDGNPCGMGTCTDLSKQGGDPGTYSCSCNFGYEATEPGGSLTCTHKVCGTLASDSPLNVKQDLIKNIPIVSVDTWLGKDTVLDPLSQTPILKAFDVAFYTCAPGYSADGTSNPEAQTVSITCNELGIFSRNADHTFKCVKKICDNLPTHSLANSNLLNDKTTPWVFEDVAEFQCDPGHTVDGEVHSATSFGVTCGEDGLFEEDGVQGCQPVACIVPEHPMASPTVSGTVLYGTAITFICDVGAGVSGSTSVNQYSGQCEADGEVWAGTDRCELITCGVPETPPGATLKVQSATFTKEGTGVCDTEVVLYSGSAMNQVDCEARCSQNDLCNFYTYSTTVPNCVLSSECPGLEGQEGETFAKQPQEFYVLSAGSCCCPYDERIEDEDQCVEAIKAVGLADTTVTVNTTQEPGFPGGCSFEANTFAGHFNSDLTGIGAPGQVQVCKRAPCGDASLSFNDATYDLASTNLGNFRQRTGDANELRYKNVGTYFGTTLDAVLTSPNWEMPTLREGLRYSTFISDNAHLAKIPLFHGARADITVEFQDHDTHAPVVLDEMHLTFFDLDGDRGGFEYVVAGDYEEVYEFPNAHMELSEEKADGRTEALATKLGRGFANPTRVDSLTQDQLQRSIAFRFHKKSKITFTVGMTGSRQPWSRAILWAFESAMVTRPPCSEYVLPPAPFVPIPTGYTSSYGSSPIKAECHEGLFVGGEGGGATYYTVSCGADGNTHPSTNQICEEVLYPVSGEVTDAQAASIKLAGATVKFKQDGVVVKEFVCDSNGIFSGSLAPGLYEFVIVLDGYITVERSLTVAGAIPVGSGADVSMSKELSDGEFRLVLSWAAMPTDLDTWVYFGPGPGAYSIKYWQMYNYDPVSGVKVWLDRDAVEGFGPETVTIKDADACPTNVAQDACLIQYTINLYSNWQEQKLGDSNGVLTVYRGNTVQAVVQIPKCVPKEMNWYPALTIDIRQGHYGEVTPGKAVLPPTLWDTSPSKPKDRGALRVPRSDEWSKLGGNQLISGMASWCRSCRRQALDKLYYHEIHYSDSTEMECEETPITLGMNDMGSCNVGFYMAGFYRTDKFDPAQYVSLWCCRAKGMPDAHGECLEADWFQKTPLESHCPATSDGKPTALVGLKREGESPDLQSITSAKCCAFPQMPLKQAGPTYDCPATS